MSNYINDALRTASDKFHGENINLHSLDSVIHNSVQNLTELDKFKKALFYGTEFNHAKLPTGRIKLMCDRLPSWIAHNSSDVEKVRAQNMIHGIIGIATEAGELLEPLRDLIANGKPIDEVNIVEEIGDLFWYCALLLSAVNSDFETAQTINIEKLKARYPQKFTEECANNRNLEKERTVLENEIDTLIKTPEHFINPTLIGLETSKKLSEVFTFTPE